MRLQSKMIAVIGVIILVVFLVWMVVAQSFFMNNYQQLERSEVQDALDATRYSLERSVAEMNETARDYAAWNDTYSFVVANNTDYIENNLVGDTFTNLRLNLILIENTDGKIVVAKAYDLVNRSFVALPGDLASLTSTSSPLFFHNESAGTSTGMLYTANGPLLVASQPIVTSTGTGPIHGTLMFGRYLTPDVVEVIAGPNKAVSAYPFGTQSPDDVQRVQPALAGGAASVIDPINATDVAGYTLLRDLYGNPSLVIKEVLPRTLYQTGLSSTNTFLGLLVIVGVISLTSLIWALRRSVLAPLLRINTSLARIRTSDDLSTRVPERGDDEIVWLARAINATLTSLESSRAERDATGDELRQSEEMLRLILNASEDAIFLVDTNGVFLTANDALAHRLGVSASEVIGMKGFTEKPDDVATQRRAHFARAIATKLPVHFNDEHAGRRLENVYHPLVDAHGNVTKVAVFSRDATERTLAEARTKEYAHTMEILNHIIAAGNLAIDVQSFVAAATKLVCELLHFDIGGVYLIDTDTPYATLRYAQGVPETARDAIEKIPYRDAPYNAILVDGNPLFAEDYVTFLPQHAPFGVASLASVPLYSKDVIIGALNVGSATPHAFSQAEKELLTAMGNEVGTVIAKLQAGEALKESEKRIRELTNALPEIIFETDVNGILTFTNATPYTRYGYTQGEIEGKTTLLDFVAPFDRERARENISARIRKEDVGWAEYDLIKKDGSTAPFAVSMTPIVRNDVYEGLRGIAIDITERKRADAALIKSERRIRELTDDLPVFVYEADETGRVTFANATSFDLFGYTKEELEAGMSIFQLVIDADKERARAVFRRRTSVDGVGRMEYTGLRKDGSTFPISVRGAPIRRDGAVVGVRGIAVDISERKRDEQKLRESDRRIREITDALPVVVYETDAKGRLTFTNATSFDLFSYTKEEVEAGMSIFQLVIDADKERARAVFRRRMSGEDVGRIEYTGQRKDGSTLPVSIRAALIRRGGAVVGMRGIIVDITERKVAEERVKEHTHTIEILYQIMTEGNRALDVQSFAKTVTDLSLELLHFDAGTIHLNDYDARHANLCYATGIPDIVVEAIGDIPLDEVLYVRVLAEGKPLFVDSYEASSVPHAAELGLKAIAIVPLYRYDTRIGVLTAGSFKPHTFSQAEKELLIAIGNEAGMVMAKLQADEVIRATLEERETLLKEIHHRVKNNMQIISSLLSLQAGQAAERETIEMLSESQRRIRSMALIHEKLYRSGSLADVDFADYVKSLIDELLRMYNVPMGVITIATDIENIQLGVDTAIPCALIINELVSNSLKHAFPDGRTGDVTVALQRTNGVYTLTVADNGVGFPADLDFRATDSLGMQLVVTLVNQLDGTITLDRTERTTFIITFKLADKLIKDSGEE